MPDELTKLLYPYGREVEWNRISELAGLTPEGDVLPPSDVKGIDRSPNPFWRNMQMRSTAR